MSDTSQWHYTDKTGQQAGPISTTELKELLSTQTISTTSMVWKDGMPGWKPVNQIEELAVPASTPAQQSPPAPAPTKAATPAAAQALAPSPAHMAQSPTPQNSEQAVNPYEAPTIPSSEERFSYETSSYGGIGRLAYFLLSIALSVALEGGKAAMGVSAFTAEGAQAAQQNSTLLLGFGAVSIIVSFFLMFSRFKNIGMSRWWTLGLLVPILNLFVSIWLVSRQEGWVETRQLDTAGKIIAWICWGLVILSIIAVGFFAFTVFQNVQPQATSMLF